MTEHKCRLTTCGEAWRAFNAEHPTWLIVLREAFERDLKAAGWRPPP